MVYQVQGAHTATGTVNIGRAATIYDANYSCGMHAGLEWNGCVYYQPQQQQPADQHNSRKHQQVNVPKCHLGKTDTDRLRELQQLHWAKMEEARDARVQAMNAKTILRGQTKSLVLFIQRLLGSSVPEDAIMAAAAKGPDSLEALMTQTPSATSAAAAASLENDMIAVMASLAPLLTATGSAEEEAGVTRPINLESEMISAMASLAPLLMPALAAAGSGSSSSSSSGAKRSMIPDDCSTRRRSSHVCGPVVLSDGGCRVPAVDTSGSADQVQTSIQGASNPATQATHTSAPPNCLTQASAATAKSISATAAAQPQAAASTAQSLLSIPFYGCTSPRLHARADCSGGSGSIDALNAVSSALRNLSSPRVVPSPGAVIISSGNSSSSSSSSNNSSPTAFAAVSSALSNLSSPRGAAVKKVKGSSSMSSSRKSSEGNSSSCSSPSAQAAVISALSSLSSPRGAPLTSPKLSQRSTASGRQQRQTEQRWWRQQ